MAAFFKVIASIRLYGRGTYSIMDSNNFFSYHELFWKYYKKLYLAFKNSCIYYQAGGDPNTTQGGMEPLVYAADT